MLISADNASSGFIAAHLELFLNHLRSETSLVYPVNNFFFAHLCGIEIDLSFSFRVTNACFFYTVKPFQGFSNYQRSCRSGHAFDFKNDFICDGGIARCRNHQQCENQRQNDKAS
jgi:hypothetical protein